MANDGGAGARRATRERQALKLRQQGTSYEDIGRALQVSSRTAWKDVQRAIARHNKHAEHDAGTVKAIELQRLDALLFGVWPQAEKGDTAASLQALRISESRRRLLGLDAPTEIKITQDDFVRFGRAVLDAVGEVISDPAARQQIALLVRGKMQALSTTAVIEARALNA